MSKNKLLSVIIPMFNVSRYIVTCLESINNQTYDNIEIIIVDDGSFDDSYEIVLKYIIDNQNKKIFLYRQENLGQSKARNYGLTLAKGSYIAFVDSDDFIHPQMYSTLISKIEKYNLDFVQCNYVNFYSENSTLNKNYSNKMFLENVISGRSFFENGPSLSPCDKVFNKEFLAKITFDFPVGHYGEDVYAISRAFFYAEKFLYINSPLYFYRRNNINSTRNSTKNLLKLCIDKIYVSNLLYEFIRINKWKGYIQVIILRNIIGSFLLSFKLKKNQRKIFYSSFKDIHLFNLLVRNFRLKFILRLINIWFFKKVFKYE